MTSTASHPDPFPITHALLGIHRCCSTCDSCEEHLHYTADQVQKQQCSDCFNVFCTDCNEERLRAFPPDDKGRTECWFCSECPTDRRYEDEALLDEALKLLGMTRAQLARKVAGEQFSVHPEKCRARHEAGREAEGK